jgi:lysophospholipase L1-like esterase
VVSPALRRLILWLWIPATIAGGIMTIEMLLQIRSAATERLRQKRSPRDLSAVQRLAQIYRPFTIQHLHPHYLFFFPLQAADKLALSNSVCSIDANGFREPGPAHAEGRKLAVMLGGSSAFGHYASSNDTTITSYLNRLQSEYFFVNAGVPSWNSTQELARLTMQIAEMRPALVIAYDGANDAALVDNGFDGNTLRYPAGTPENFDRLEQVVEHARRPWTRITWRGLFPEISNRIDKYNPREEPRRPTLDRAIVDAAARAYAGNLSRMAAVSRDFGARFVAVFQPIAGLHRHVAVEDFDPRDFADTAAFHRTALEVKRTDLEFLDLAAMFDDELATIPVDLDDLTDQTIFVDEVHVTDRGNEMIARRLLRELQRQQ